MPSAAPAMGTSAPTIAAQLSPSGAATAAEAQAPMMTQASRTVPTTAQHANTALPYQSESDTDAQGTPSSANRDLTGFNKNPAQNNGMTPREKHRRDRGRDYCQSHKDSDSESSYSKRGRPRRRTQQVVTIKTKGYSGQDQSYNLDNFTEYLEQQDRYYQWTEQEYVEHALICLTGPALTCVSENVTPITNWEQLKKLLHATLEPDGSEITYLHQLNTMRLKKDESLSCYTDRIKRIGKLAYPDIKLIPREKMLVKVFTAGLNNSDVTKAIAFQQVRTLNDALRVAASDPAPAEANTGDAITAVKTALKKPTVQIAQVSSDQVDHLTGRLLDVLQAVGAREIDARQPRYRRDQTPPANRYYESREARDQTPPPRRYSYESREAAVSNPPTRQQYGERRSPGPSYNNRPRERSKSPAPGYTRYDSSQSPGRAYQNRPRSTSVDRRAVCYKCRML
jgi:hypothetical protein